MAGALQATSVRARLGGVLIRVDGVLRFVPASLVIRIAPAPRVTRIPGAHSELLGVAAYEGAIVPVIAIGSARREMIVCRHAGEIVCIQGGEVVRSDTFDLAPGRDDVVEHEGEPAQLVDLPAIYARVQSSGGPGRWVR